jgi:hypothetical protein
MNRAPWLQSVGAFTLSRVLGFARSSRFIGLPSGHFSETVGQSVPSTGDAAAGAELSAAEELAAKQVRFPFPQWALEGNSARAWILANAVRGGAGAGLAFFVATFLRLFSARWQLFPGVTRSCAGIHFRRELFLLAGVLKRRSNSYAPSARSRTQMPGRGSMGFVEKNLLPNEQITYRANLHWIIYLVPVIVILAAIALALASYGIAAIAVGAIGLLLMVPPWIKSSSSEFAITNKRVVIKVGLVRRHSLELLLQKVEGIGVDQGIIGRILGYGTIIVSGVGGTKEAFPRISNPLEFRRQVQASLAP